VPWHMHTDLKPAAEQPSVAAASASGMGQR
jgi:hypothetical protein